MASTQSPSTIRVYSENLPWSSKSFSNGSVIVSVLDMGCGPGWTSLFLAQAGFDVVGVDISERMVEIARDRGAQCNIPTEFLVGDMEDLNLERKDFGGVLFFDCLHHCPAYPQALQRAYAHLRPGGHVLLFETTLLHRYSPHAKQASRTFGITELGFSRRQLRHALREAGFSDIAFYHDPGPTYRGIPGFLKACLRLWCDFVFYFPQAKNIVIARKA